MGALANATVLRKDTVFIDWIETAIAYEARVILTSESSSTPDYDVRRRLATDAAVSPKMILDIMVTAVATDPALASKGTVVGTQITESDILDGVQGAWTVIAKLTYGG
jgi:hypothetical protein